MKIKVTKAVLSLMVATFVSLAVLIPALPTVFAAEQTNGQDLQTPPADSSQNENKDHASHHHQ